MQAYEEKTRMASYFNIKTIYSSCHWKKPAESHRDTHEHTCFWRWLSWLLSVSSTIAPCTYTMYMSIYFSMHIVYMCRYNLKFYIDFTYTCWYTFVIYIYIYSNFKNVFCWKTYIAVSLVLKLISKLEFNSKGIAFAYLFTTRKQ